MSRFADPEATARFDLGACQCPGTPHESDWIDMRSELGSREVLRMAAGDSLQTLELLIVRWNLLDNDGTVAPVDREHIERLYADTFEALDTFISEHVRIGSALPNASAARSRASTRASGSRTPRVLKAS